MGEGDATFTAQDIAVVGDTYGNVWDPEPTTGIDPVADPLAALAPPPIGPCTHDGEYAIDFDTTLSPGVYCGGLKLSGDAQVKLNPGIYVIAGGGLRINDGASARGTGLLFYLTESKDYDYKQLEVGTFAATVKLHAATSGPWKGVLFFQDRNVVTTELNEFKNDATGDYSGAFYFPTTNVSFTDRFHVDSADVVVIANRIEIDDDVVWNVNVTNPLAVLPDLLAEARLVE